MLTRILRIEKKSNNITYVRTYVRTHTHGSLLLFSFALVHCVVSVTERERVKAYWRQQSLLMLVQFIHYSEEIRGRCTIFATANKIWQMSRLSVHSKKQTPKIVAGSFSTEIQLIHMNVRHFLSPSSSLISLDFSSFSSLI